MRRVYPEAGWPEAWRLSYAYDLEEIYEEIRCRGYAYAYRNRVDYAMALLRQAVAPGATVLDMAAAQGNISLAAAEQGYHVTWNDFRADLAEYVKRKDDSGRISYAPGNAFDLTFPVPFDAVFINEVIEHVAHPDRFLMKTASLVKPGGWIVMTTPNGEYFRNKLPRFSDFPDPAVFESQQFGPNGEDHIFLLHLDEVHAFAVSAGLRVAQVRLFNNPLTSGHMKLERALRGLPRSWVDKAERASQRLPQPLARRLLVHMAVLFQRPVTPLAAAS
jgi:2-polyprenyl-3-methyl-5-hydroxy-6-metoxy-1,4-benzoquinol methylase